MARARDPLPEWSTIVEMAEAEGIAHLGVAPAQVLDRARAELYRRREAGLSADMGFTYRNPDRSTDPQRAVAEARSVIVAAKPYVADSEPQRPDGTMGRVGRYAWVDHYEPLRQSLRVIARRLKSAGERAVVFADDNSIVDREVAYLGGLGWFGKNANLLIRGGGSFFVLGCVVTTAEYPVSEQVPDGCGTCTRCIDGCPTGAIVAPGVVDANRCLAWLLQQQGTFPHEFREALGDRIYGCDDCQEVCPPAVRLGDRHRVALPDHDPYGDQQEPQPFVDLIELLQLTDDEILNRHGRWYIPKRDPRWVRRNALVAIGNSADPTDRTRFDEALAELRRYSEGADELLAEHANWALERLMHRHATLAGPT